MIGNKIVRYDTVDSTSDVCSRLIEKGDPEDVVVIARAQTQGRGRLNRQWFSPAGEGLYFSFILKPQTGLKDITLYTVIAALAVLKTLKEMCGLEAKIKWPNDIILAEKKLSGILVEKKRDYLITGIGINMRNDKDGFPADLEKTATSIKIEKGTVPDSMVFLQRFLELYEDYYFGLRNGGKKELIEEAGRNSCTLGTVVVIESGGQKISGLATGLDQDGALIIRSADGKIVKVNSGETKWQQEA